MATNNSQKNTAYNSTNERAKLASRNSKGEPAVALSSTRNKPSFAGLVRSVWGFLRPTQKGLPSSAGDIKKQHPYASSTSVSQNSQAQNTDQTWVEASTSCEDTRQIRPEYETEPADRRNMNQSQSTARRSKKPRAPLPPTMYSPSQRDDIPQAHISSSDLKSEEEPAKKLEYTIVESVPSTTNADAFAHRIDLLHQNNKSTENLDKLADELRKRLEKISIGQNNEHSEALEENPEPRTNSDTNVAEVSDHSEDDGYEDISTEADSNDYRTASVEQVSQEEAHVQNEQEAEIPEDVRVETNAQRENGNNQEIVDQNATPEDKDLIGFTEGDSIKPESQEEQKVYSTNSEGDLIIPTQQTLTNHISAANTSRQNSLDQDASVQMPMRGQTVEGGSNEDQQVNANMSNKRKSKDEGGLNRKRPNIENLYRSGAPRYSPVPQTHPKLPSPSQPPTEGSQNQQNNVTGNSSKNRDQKDDGPSREENQKLSKRPEVTKDEEPKPLAEEGPKSSPETPTAQKRTDRAAAKLVEQDQAEEFVQRTLQKIQSILDEVTELQEEMSNFPGTDTSDRDYIYMDEVMMRNMIKLDNIETKNNQIVRKKRKEGIQFIQSMMQRLDGKLHENQEKLKNQKTAPSGNSNDDRDDTTEDDSTTVTDDYSSRDDETSLEEVLSQK